MNRDRERGVSALEFAIALPVMLLLLWGVVGFASMFYVQTAFSGAAADGARLAASLPQDEVESRVTASVQRALAHFGVGTGHVRVIQGPGLCAAAGHCIVVRINAPYRELRGTPVLAPITLPLIGAMTWLPERMVAEASVLR